MEKDLTQMVHISQHGQLTDLEGSEKEFKLHPYANEKGGILLKDEEGLIPSTIKNLAAKVADKIMRG